MLLRAGHGPGSPTDPGSLGPAAGPVRGGGLCEFCWGADVGGDPFDFGPHPGGSGWAPPGAPGQGNLPGGPIQYGPPPGPAPTTPGPAPGATAQWPPPTDRSGFDPPDLSATTVGKPPLGWLVAALVVGLVGAVLAFFGDNPVVAVVAWALAGPGAIGLLAVFAQRDVGQRALPIYISSPGRTTALYWAAIAVAAVGIAVSAWYLALWAGRL